MYQFAAVEQTSTANPPAFFSKFLKQCAFEGLMKLSLLRQMLLLQIILLQDVKKNQDMTKEPFFGAPHGILTCLLTLSLRKTHICVFPDYLSFCQFLATSCYFQKLRLRSLNSLILGKTSQTFCRLNVLVCYCAANQYNKTACIFSKF